MADVIEIVGEPPRGITLGPVTHGLRPPGETGAHEMPQLVEGQHRRQLGHVVGLLRAGRPDYRAASLSRSLTGMVNAADLTAGRGGERLGP